MDMFIISSLSDKNRKIFVDYFFFNSLGHSQEIGK